MEINAEACVSLGRRIRQAEGRELREMPAITRIISKWLSKAKKTLPHPLVGILIGFLIAFAGRSELPLRSYGMLIIALWMIVELWAWLLPLKDASRLKYMCGWTATSVLLIGVMGLMWWWMDGKLQDQREDVWNGLTAGHTSDSDPTAAIFSVTNGSRYVISRRHQIICYTILAIGNAGTSTITYAATWATPGQLHMSGSLEQAHIEAKRTLADSPMEPGGDVESDPCLQFYRFAGRSNTGTVCADIALIFWYTLDTQPDLEQERQFRFIARRTAYGAYSWWPSPLQAKGSQCWYSADQERQNGLRANHPELKP